MIAVGGSIGTGLFIGSGKALRTGGPAGKLNQALGFIKMSADQMVSALVIDWIIMGVMLLNTCQAIGEMAMYVLLKHNIPRGTGTLFNS